MTNLSYAISSLFRDEPVVTAGVVSSIVAAGITIIQYTLPLFLGVILGGVIENASNANTWSVITTLLHGSRLHTVSFSDSVSTRNVARPVFYLYYLGLFTLGLTALSSVITPLGIYDIRRERVLNGVPFLPVTGCLLLGNDAECLLIAAGTFPQQMPYQPTRACGLGLMCPGQENRTVVSRLGRRNVERSGDGTGSSKDIIDSSISTHSETAERTGHRTHLARSLELPNQTYPVGLPVPEPLTELFGNTSYYGASVASVFDIQYRRYQEFSSNKFQPGDTRWRIGSFNFLSSVISHGRYTLIDGLVINNFDAGVGFRKHSIPDGDQFYGKPWDEVLLWIGPKTKCVANNVSLEMTEDADKRQVFQLMDQGGFGQLAGLEEPQMVADDARSPDLMERAWRGAYFFNRQVGTEAGAWVQGGDNGSSRIKESGVWVDDLLVVIKSKRWQLGGGGRMPLGAKIVDGKQDTTGVDTHCAGFVPSTAAGAPLVTCGLVIGGPNLTELSLSERWVYPLFTCATAIRASLKVVSFDSNSSRLDSTTPSTSLWITDEYTMRTPPPTWSIELAQGFKASEISLLWGPVGPVTNNTENLRTLEADYLYLPAGQGSDRIFDSIAGTGAYQHAAGMMYRSDESMLDYGGGKRYALLKEWMLLTSDEEMVQLVPDLLWLDLFVNMVTTWSPDGNRTGNLREYESVVRYDMRYSVPVLVLLALWVGAGVVSFVFWKGDRVRVREMRQLLNQLSTGRLLVNMLDESDEAAVPTKSWASGKGDTVLGLKCRGTATAEAADGEEGYQKVGGMVVGFVDAPVEGRVMEVLKGWEEKTM